jgi:hypothetical protein
MATIAIRDLQPLGYNLFSDGESYLMDISSEDELNASGGLIQSTTTYLISSTGLCLISGVAVSIVAYTIFA